MSASELGAGDGERDRRKQNGQGRLEQSVPGEAQGGVALDLVDMSACEQELIHIPGSIQPHGALLTLREPDLTIVQVSANTGDVLGAEPKDLLGKDLGALAPQAEALAASLAQPDLAPLNPLHLTLRVRDRETTFDAIAHRTGGVIALELEEAASQGPTQFLSFYHVVKASLTTLQTATSLGDLCQCAADEVRSITGFDRVMVYQFDADWNGTVRAEARAPELEPYLGLRYPASDIPRQARELYARNWLRFVVDANYTPAPLIPALNPVTGQPLDMSFSTLRSVSPFHIQYLKNMGVGASLSVSIVQDGQLWGLISCHHRTPKNVPYEVRMACEFLGQALSTQIAAQEQEEERQYELTLRTIRQRLGEYMATSERFAGGLARYSQPLLDLVGAQGAAICLDDEWTLMGATPSHQQIASLLVWLDGVEGDSYASDSLPRVYPPARAFKDVASGVLAIRIARRQRQYVVWFRPEVIQTVNWGGNPTKQGEEVNGVLSLSPRRSFELWKETVQLSSLPWKAAERDAALELRNTILSAALQKAVDDLARANDELARSNGELDSFAYIASHDLKEPLRGISSYASMLELEYGDALGAGGQARLKTIGALSERMGSLIDSLLNYSRAGRLDLAVAPTNLNTVLEEAIEMLDLPITERQIEIRVPRPLPTVVCDRARVGEIFFNLISNAIKYNDKPQKWIEIGYLTPGEQDDGMRRRVASAQKTSAAAMNGEPDGDAGRAGSSSAVDNREPPVVFYVRDNGIGISSQHFDLIFTIFKRLHRKGAFGGGTGAGLTIAKKIVERHTGTIWVESTVGEGTTFYFTLASGGGAT